MSVHWLGFRSNRLCARLRISFHMIPEQANPDLFVDADCLLYGFGVRSLGITYSESNALGSGLKEPGDGGLTTFGRRAVKRMNQVGMLIDCSHCGDQTTLDVIEYSDAPIILSHIGARALWESNRLAPDSVLEACAKKNTKTTVLTH